MDMSWNQIGMLAFGSLVVSLITGKFLKKAVVLLIAPWIRKSKNTTDDQLLDAAEDDWNVTDDKRNEKK